MCLKATFVGEPDAGNPHVRFDERDVETGHGEAINRPLLNYRATSRLYASRRVEANEYSVEGPFVRTTRAERVVPFSTEHRFPKLLAGQ